MKKLITIAILFLSATIALAQNVSGTYYGVSNGADIVCKVTQAGNTIKGVLNDDASSYVFKGTYSNGYTKGTVIVDNTYTFNYTGTFSGSNFKATLIGQNGSITVHLSKNKSSSNTSTASSQQRDSRVLGRWMHESVMSSAGYGDYMSSVSVTYYHFFNDGTYSEVFKSGAGGNNWSSSGSGEKRWEHGTRRTATCIQHATGRQALHATSFLTATCTRAQKAVTCWSRQTKELNNSIHS